MRFNLSKKASVNCEEWHRWFAWRPVRISPTEICWLEWVERKCTYNGNWAGGDWENEYRASMVMV
jgi:hypothetical protein